MTNPPVSHVTDGDCWCHTTDLPVEREDGSIGWVVVHEAEPQNTLPRRPS